MSIYLNKQLYYINQLLVVQPTLRCGCLPHLRQVPSESWRPCPSELKGCVFSRLFSACPKPPVRARAAGRRRSRALRAPRPQLFAPGLWAVCSRPRELVARAAPSRLLLRFVAPAFVLTSGSLVRSVCLSCKATWGHSTCSGRRVPSATTPCDTSGHGSFDSNKKRGRVRSL